MPGSIPTKIVSKLSEAARTCFQIQLCNYLTDLFFPTIVSNMQGLPAWERWPIRRSTTLIRSSICKSPTAFRRSRCFPASVTWAEKKWRRLAACSRVKRKRCVKPGHWYWMVPFHPKEEGYNPRHCKPNRWSTGNRTRFSTPSTFFGCAMPTSLAYMEVSMWREDWSDESCCTQSESKPKPGHHVPSNWTQFLLPR